MSLESINQSGICESLFRKFIFIIIIKTFDKSSKKRKFKFKIFIENYAKV